MKDQECGICREEIRDLKGQMNCCQHEFCFDCIFEWSKVTNTCPLCKSSFQTLHQISIKYPDKSTTHQIPEKRQQVHYDSDFTYISDDSEFDFEMDDFPPFSQMNIPLLDDLLFPNNVLPFDESSDSESDWDWPDEDEAFSYFLEGYTTEENVDDEENQEEEEEEEEREEEEEENWVRGSSFLFCEVDEVCHNKEKEEIDNITLKEQHEFEIQKREETEELKRDSLQSDLKNIQVMRHQKKKSHQNCHSSDKEEEDSYDLALTELCKLVNEEIQENAAENKGNEDQKIGAENSRDIQIEEKDLIQNSKIRQDKEEIAADDETDEVEKKTRKESIREVKFKKPKQDDSQRKELESIKCVILKKEKEEDLQEHETQEHDNDKRRKKKRKRQEDN